MWLSLSIFCFSFQVSFRYALIASLPSRKGEVCWLSQSLLLLFEKSFSYETTSWVAGLLTDWWSLDQGPIGPAMAGVGQYLSLGGIFECGRYWMICPLEDFFNNLTIMYWPTMGRNVFFLSSFWKGKSKRSHKGKGRSALFTFEAEIVR